MQYEVKVERDIRVSMRDGITLATDVYRPAQDGQAVAGAFPVILERTPYGKRNPSRSEIRSHEPERPLSREDVAAFFVQYGYVVGAMVLLQQGGADEVGFVTDPLDTYPVPEEPDAE